MINREQQPMGSQFDPEMINQLKKEIVNDLKTRREWQEEYYGGFDEYGENFEGNRPRAGYGMGYAGRGPGYGAGMGPGRYYGWCPAPMPMYRGRKRPEFDYDWWIDREEYDYQRNMALLRRQLQRELGTVDRINQRLGQVRDPQVRQMIHDLLQEAWRQGMDVPEIMQSLNKDNVQGYNSLLDRITGSFKGIDRRSFGWGVGAGLLGLLFLPSLSKSLRPFARKAMEEAMDITDRAQGVFARAKEEFEDIVAEASFNKIKETAANSVDLSGEKEPPAK